MEDFLAELRNEVEQTKSARETIRVSAARVNDDYRMALENAHAVVGPKISVMKSRAESRGTASSLSRSRAGTASEMQMRSRELRLPPQEEKKKRRVEFESMQTLAQKIREARAKSREANKPRSDLVA